MHDPIGAVHGGGSCQVSFSYDEGSNWVVVQSWEGNCPRVRKGQEGQATNTYDVSQDYSFRVPENFPSSDKVIVSWYAHMPLPLQDAYFKLTGHG